MKALQQYLNEKNLYTEKSYQKMLQFFSILSEKNAQFNLTAITDQTEAEQKHFIDSLSGENFLSGEILDIGAGAGFPSIPLAIVREELNFTLCESVGKKISFLNEIKEQLNIDNINPVKSRIEELAGKCRFDTVLARGVAPLPVLCEYALPFLNIGGRLIAYKGQKAGEEIVNAQKALRILGGELEKMIPYSLTVHAEIFERNLILIQKRTQTPKEYPRGQNRPRLKPL